MNDDLQQSHQLLCSSFVDEGWYRAAVGAGRGDLGGLVRYMRLPVAQRPRLSPFFDADFYRATQRHVIGDADPLLHFLAEGLAAWRDPHPLVDLHWLAGEAAAPGAVLSVDQLTALLEGDAADPSPYFDQAFYATQAEVPATGRLRHFLVEGMEAGLRPNPWLDPLWYGQAYDDVPGAGAAGAAYLALRDFILGGDAQGRRAGPGFDGTLYRRRYTDVADAGVPPLRHFLANGRAEGRQVPADRPRPPVIPPAPTAIAESPVAAGPQPLDPTAMQAAYRDLETRYADMRQAEKDAVVCVPPPMLVCADPAADMRRIRLPRHARPVLSILVPAFNEADHTVACLLAIARTPPRVAFEVVLADDCSTDPVMLGLARVANLIVLRQAENVGFLRNCNAGFLRCRGRLVLLLNNDAQPVGDAIDTLVAAIDADPGLGAVGPKIVYPSGRLQEAGCFLTPNGESGMVGLFGDAAAPGFSYDRDVAYCSGAALLLRRALAAPVLFDEAYLPAYCEDADLCLRLQAAGHRVRYVAGATFAHHLSVSTNRDAGVRRLQGIARNQHRLQGRWGELLAEMDRVRPIAFHLPQFHPTPENDLWWGVGFTEWHNVARARPSFAGHYQPHLPADLGFYDLRLPDALRAQAALAERYGVEGFCVYYYGFGARRLLSAPLDVLHANPDIGFRHCLCWANENWTKHWDGGEREILMEQRYDAATLTGVVADLVRHAADPRYIRVGGAALVLVYRPLQLPDARAFADMCRIAFREAGQTVHLVYVESMEAVGRGLSPADIGFDAAVEFPPHGRAVAAETAAQITKPGWSGYRYDYAETVLAFLARPDAAYRRYPAAFPSWDNTPRQSLRGTSFDDATPEAFRFYVERKIDEARRFLMGGERLLFINAWNEWAEGAHLEPDMAYGHRWLEALRDALDDRAWA